MKLASLARPLASGLVVGFILADGGVLGVRLADIGASPPASGLFHAMMCVRRASPTRSGCALV